MSLTQFQTTHVLPRTLLTGIVEAICDRSEDTPEQREERFRDVVAAVEAHAPRDAMEVMLAGLAVLHAHLIQDSARDLLREQDDRIRSRTKSAIAALDRGMLGFLRELRIARKRPLGTDGMHQKQAAETGAVADAHANVTESNQYPEPEIVFRTPIPMRVSEPPVPPATPPVAEALNSPFVLPSNGAKQSVVPNQTRPFARLPLTAKAKRQHIKALKILARRAAAANRAQAGRAAPAVAAPDIHAG
jgi:hypothetical protein